MAIVAELAAAAATVAVRAPSDGEQTSEAGRSGSTTTTTASAGTVAQAQGTTSTTSAGPGIIGVPPERLEELEEIKAQVAEIRGLEWRRPLKITLASPTDLARKLNELVDKEIEENRAQIAADEASLKMLKLIPEGLDYAETYQDLLAGAVVGFYDDETEDLFVGSPRGRLDASTRSVVVHEMVHALTDQHFDFGPRVEALDEAGRTEEAAALVAVIEGDAELVRGLWMDEHLSDEEQLEALLGGGEGSSVPPDAPRYILDALYFPYSRGTEFVQRVYRTGRFGAVDAAYRDPPTSTEQIFHPQRFLERQGWTAPAAPDLVQATGCQGVDSGNLGEFDMRHILAQHIGSDDAERAADGWNGDVFTLVRCGSARGFADRWRTDPGIAPDRLAGALRQWAPGWSGASEVTADGRFAGPRGAGRIVTSGDHVDLVLADDAATAERVASAFTGR